MFELYAGKQRNLALTTPKSREEMRLIGIFWKYRRMATQKPLHKPCTFFSYHINLEKYTTNETVIQANQWVHTDIHKYVFSLWAYDYIHFLSIMIFRILNISGAFFCSWSIFWNHESWRNCCGFFSPLLSWAWTWAISPKKSKKKLLYVTTILRGTTLKKNHPAHTYSLFNIAISLCVLCLPRQVINKQTRR